MFRTIKSVRVFYTLNHTSFEIKYLHFVGKILYHFPEQQLRQSVHLCVGLDSRKQRVGGGSVIHHKTHCHFFARLVVGKSDYHTLSAGHGCLAEVCHKIFRKQVLGASQLPVSAVEIVKLLRSDVGGFVIVFFETEYLFLTAVAVEIGENRVEVGEILNLIGVTRGLRKAVPAERQPVGELRCEILRKIIQFQVFETSHKLITDFFFETETLVFALEIGFQVPYAVVLRQLRHQHIAHPQLFSDKERHHCLHFALAVAVQQHVPRFAGAHSLHPPMLQKQRYFGMRFADLPKLFLVSHL